MVHSELGTNTNKLVHGLNRVCLRASTLSELVSDIPKLWTDLLMQRVVSLNRYPRLRMIILQHLAR